LKKMVALLAALPLPLPASNNRHQITILPLKTKRKSPMEKKLKMGIRPAQQCDEFTHSLRTFPGKTRAAADTAKPPGAVPHLEGRQRTDADVQHGHAAARVRRGSGCPGWCVLPPPCIMRGSPLPAHGHRPTGTGSLQRVRVARRGWVGGSGWERQPQGW
jgi:hypothetical protein